MGTILVTGGAGYIGAHVVRRLRDAQWTILVLDDLSTGKRSAAGGAELVVGDIRDAALLSRLFGERPIDGVVHLAALALVGESVREPADYYSINVEGSLCLLDAMRRHGVRDIVFSSSAAVYGEPGQLPIAETHPRRPSNPYGETKRVIEKTLEAYRRAYGMRYVALRYFNAAGATAAGELGENRQNETHLIPRLLLAAREDGPPVPIHGDDYPTADGTCVRDYVHVEDLAAAHVTALERLRAGAVVGAAINLGLGRGHSVREVVAAVERVTGKAPPVVFSARRPGDPAELVADPAEATLRMGWSPQWTELEAIVDSAWRWHSRLSTEVDGA